MGDLGPHKQAIKLSRPIDDQERQTLDRVWKYFIEEGHEPGVDENNCCMYRTEDGEKCAIGCLLSDETWERMQGGDDNPNSLDITSLLYYYREALEYGGMMESVAHAFFCDVEAGRHDFLATLQRAHDQAALKNMMKCSQPEFGERFKERLSWFFGYTGPQPV